MKNYTRAFGTHKIFHYLLVQQKVISNTYSFTKQEWPIVNFTQIIYTIPAPKAKLIAFGVKLEAMEKFTSERQYTLSLSLVKGNIHYLFH